MIKIYLAGPIEKTTDGGRGIRKVLRDSSAIKEVLKKYNCEFDDPCDFKLNTKYKNFKEIIEQEENWQVIIKKIVQSDLIAVHKSDAVVVIVNKDISFGSVSEISLALHHNIPVLGYVQDVDINKMHPWIGSCLSSISRTPLELAKAIEDFALPYIKNS